MLAGERNGCLCCGELPSEPGDGPLDRQPTDNICLCLRVALLCITVICNVAVRTTVPRLLFSYILLHKFKCDPEQTLRVIADSET